MIYERWFTVKDCNGLDYLYYSEIRKKPFDNAVKHQNKSFKGILEKRMNGLLKKNVSVDLNYQNLNYYHLCQHYLLHLLLEEDFDLFEEVLDCF